MHGLIPDNIINQIKKHRFLRIKNKAANLSAIYSLKHSVLDLEKNNNLSSYAIMAIQHTKMIIGIFEYNLKRLSE